MTHSSFRWNNGKDMDVNDNPLNLSQQRALDCKDSRKNSEDRDCERKKMLPANELQSYAQRSLGNNILDKILHHVCETFKIRSEFRSHSGLFPFSLPACRLLLGVIDGNCSDGPHKIPCGMISDFAHNAPDMLQSLEVRPTAMLIPVLVQQAVEGGMLFYAKRIDLQCM